MAALLDSLERESPNVRSVMFNALRNVSPTHLLDKQLLHAWQQRPPDAEPPRQPVIREQRAAALPVRSNLRLPLLPREP